jgi:hypothetical protein
MKAQRKRRIIDVLLFNLGARWCWVVTATLRPFLSCERDLVPTVQKFGEPQGRSGWVRKISPLPVFDPPTVQREESRYTD